MEKKTVAVLGGGNGAHVMAADLALKGHHVRMFEMSAYKGHMQKVFDTGEIVIDGVINGTAKLDLVTDDLEQAVDGADIICLVTPAFAHPSYAEMLKGKVHKDQILITFPGAFGSLVIKKVFGDAECPVLADTNNLPYTARLKGPGHVTCTGRSLVNIGFFPGRAAEKYADMLREVLFPFHVICANVLEAGLSLINPAFHTGPCLLNITNIERPDVRFFVYEQGFSPSSAKVDKALDDERKAVGKALGADLHPLEDFLGLPVNTYTWQDLYKAGHGDIAMSVIEGPNDINNRYLTEDTPFGLVPWTQIGKQIGVDMPVTNGIIDIYNVIHGKDWRKDGITAEDMGIDKMTKEELMRYVETGE
ncbi:MAG: NAD/NADP octopine/nopaline dehydrogenase family protein [Anaerovoracaceae bacterium]|jgi:opine dehydrogenase